jgi:digeranylgeranylglycerophospholipid reductase
LLDFDAVVVGAGSTGLWASIAAARNGARTLLIERKNRIGDGLACAEGVGAKGIGQFLDLKQEWIGARINGAKLFSPGGECIEIESPGCGYVLNKDRFLHGLSVMAANEGVEIWLVSEVRSVASVDSGDLEVDVGGYCRKRSVRCGAVIAADGIESRIGRKAGIRDAFGAGEVFSCAQYTVAPIDADPDIVEFHFGRETAPGGYAWVFPKGDSVANIGIGVTFEKSHDLNPSDYLARFKSRRSPRSKILGFVVGGVPFGKSRLKSSGGGVFLAGDAAGIADPISGAGIVPGMESAEISGRFASDYARDRSRARTVEREFARNLRSKFKDRRLRLAVRKVLSNMDDEDLSRMIPLCAEFVSRGGEIHGDLLRTTRFFIRSMPKAFGMLKHLLKV